MQKQMPMSEKLLARVPDDYEEQLKRVPPALVQRLVGMQPILSTNGSVMGYVVKGRQKYRLRYSLPDNGLGRAERSIEIPSESAVGVKTMLLAFQIERCQYVEELRRQRELDRQYERIQMRVIRIAQMQHDVSCQDDAPTTPASKLPRTSRPAASTSSSAQVKQKMAAPRAVEPVTPTVVHERPERRPARHTRRFEPAGVHAGNRDQIGRAVDGDSRMLLSTVACIIPSDKKIALSLCCDCEQC